MSRDQDISRLPKWARRRLESAERRVEELHRDLEAKGKIVSTDLPGVSYWHDVGTGYCIPSDTVTFRTKEGSEFQVRMKGEALVIKQLGNVHLDLAVFPRCSNVCELKAIK